MADKFPQSLPEFQRMFPDDAACAKYLEAIRWRDGFRCPKCGVTAEPYPIETQRAAMGIDWMSVERLSQSIPPAYGEHVGRAAMVALELQRGAA